MSEPVQAVIFDMDGLLVDSEPFWRQAEQAVFPRVGIHLTDAMCMQTMGTRVDEVVRHWHSVKPWNHPSLEAVQRDIVDVVVGLGQEKARPMEGVDHILNFFQARDTPMAIASSSSQRLIDAVVNKLDIAHYFALLQSAEDEPYGKPHPGVFLRTAERLGADPARCLVFEDSFAGMIAALAARMRVVAVPDAHYYDQVQFGAAHIKLRSLNAFDELSLATLESPD